MVEAGAGDDFGDDPLRFLLDLKRNGGVMLAVCTAHYAEMTASRYSSHEELRYCHEHRIQVLPLRTLGSKWMAFFVHVFSVFFTARLSMWLSCHILMARQARHG